MCEQKKLSLWHQKLGHLSSKNIKSLLKNSTGMELTDDIKMIENPRDVCLRDKYIRFSSKS